MYIYIYTYVPIFLQALVLGFRVEEGNFHLCSGGQRNCQESDIEGPKAANPWRESQTLEGQGFRV